MTFLGRVDRVWESIRAFLLPPAWSEIHEQHVDLHRRFREIDEHDLNLVLAAPHGRWKEGGGLYTRSHGRRVVWVLEDREGGEVEAASLREVSEIMWKAASAAEYDELVARRLVRH